MIFQHRIVGAGKRFAGQVTTWTALFAVAALTLASCSFIGGSEVNDDTNPEDVGGDVLRIVSGSENRTLEPIIQEFADANGFEVLIEYSGSVDIMLMLEHGQLPYDAVWPANSLWLDLGDEHGIVKNAESIIRQPVVFGVKRSIAERLGWIDSDVSVADILAAAEAGEVNFTMTSATQSNSGASAYMGFLNAFAGSPEVLTSEHLNDPTVQDQVTRILGQVERSSGSSGWLKELFLDRYPLYDAMFNYEPVIIEANQELVARGDEPLYAVYPTDGLAVSDSPLAFIESADAVDGKLDVEAAFDDLQAHLLDPETQRRMVAMGRRAGALQLTRNDVDSTVFNPDWGIDVERVISPIRLPAPAVIDEALVMYQTVFRKPSLTVFALDYSGSMTGTGEQQLRQAMGTLLTPASAERLLLQPSDEDINIVVAFDSAPFQELRADGNSDAALSTLLRQINELDTRGGTDIYQAAARGIDLIAQENVQGYSPAVILMTDGQSSGDLSVIADALTRNNIDVPVFGITFGDADEEQLEMIAERTGARVFDGGSDLVEAFRTAKGYN